MQQEEIDALPDSLRETVIRIAERVRVPYENVLAAIYDQATMADLESFTSDDFGRYTRRSYVPRKAPLKRQPVEYGYSVPVNR